MSHVFPTALPAGALLAGYRQQGAYTDCYALDLDGRVAFASYVEAFYTSRLFKLERAILSVAAGKPSRDEEARQLAQGGADRFSAWAVEGRLENQLLLCDFMGRTRSWLMAAAVDDAGRPATRLYFGSAVVPRRGRDGRLSMGLPFHALLGFHRLYSRALLKSAQAGLARGGPGA